MSIYGAIPRGGYKQQPRKIPRSLGFARYALGFDGVDDYIETPLNGFPDPMTDITIVFRASPSGLMVHNSVFATIPFEPANIINLHFPSPVDGRIHWSFGDYHGGGNLLVPWSTAWNNVWAHWVGSSKSGVGQKMYRDNVLLGSSNTWSTFSPRTKVLYIAKSTTPFWTGLIDYVLIYNRALSVAEIRHNQLNYHNPVRDGLVLWLPMEEGSGETVYDKSGFNNHGTLLPAGAGPTWKRLRQWELRAAVE